MASAMMLRSVTVTGTGTVRVVGAAVPMATNPAAHAPRRAVTGTRLRQRPTVEQVQGVSSDLQDALRSGILTPGPRNVGVTEVDLSPRDIARANHIQNFLGDPPFMRMVESLATDENFYNSALENQAVQEYIRNYNSAPAIEDGGDGATGPPRNIFSRLYGKAKQALDSFIQSFLDFMATLFDKLPGPREVIKAAIMFAMIVVVVLILMG